MILDPPAFAKHHNVLNNALQGHNRLNAKAIGAVGPGGIIFTFSCSQAVSRENFRKSVFVAAANTGEGARSSPADPPSIIPSASTTRKVRVLHQLTQPVDHPVSIYHPEGARSSPADPAGRSSRQHLPSGRGLFKGIGPAGGLNLLH